jgi:hypothetical protein
LSCLSSSCESWWSGKFLSDFCWKNRVKISVLDAGSLGKSSHNCIQMVDPTSNDWTSNNPTLNVIKATQHRMT